MQWARDPGVRTRPQFGLEDLAALVSEMQKTKAGANNIQNEDESPTPGYDLPTGGVSSYPSGQLVSTHDTDADMDCFGDGSHVSDGIHGPG